MSDLDTRTTPDTTTPDTAPQHGGTMVPAHVLRWALEAAGAAAAKPSDGFPTLTCLQVSASSGELTVAATDRYTVAAVTMPWDGPDFAQLLTPEDCGRLLALCKAQPKASRARLEVPQLVVTVQPGGLHVSDIATSLTLVDACEQRHSNLTYGQYPSWRRLLPEVRPQDGKGAGTVLLSSSKLVRLLKALGADTKVTVQTGDTATRPVRLDAEHVDGGARYVGLIMPIRRSTA